MRTIFIVGPTGVGKSDLAFKWAKSVGGHILNADSVQCFQSLNIGSNKPSKKLQAEIPHHLFDIVKEGGEFTAGDFRRSALRTLKHLCDRKVSYVFIVGGSGFYLQALLKGMPSLPTVSIEERNNVIKSFKKDGLDCLYKELRDKDIAYAERVHHRDVHRVLRAIEILRTQSQTITQMLKGFQPCLFPYPKVVIGLKCNKNQLRQKIHKRTCQMLEIGLIDEVQELVQKGLKDWPMMKSVGYKQVMHFLEEKIKKEDMVDEIVCATMRLAKKQMTWFRNKYTPYWIDVDNIGQYHDVHKTWQIGSKVIDNKKYEDIKR